MVALVTSVDVEQLIEQDHSARAIWDLVGRLNLTAFLSPMESVEGQAGRPAFDPQLLLSLWLYAYSRGISSARVTGISGRTVVLQRI